MKLSANPNSIKRSRWELVKAAHAWLTLGVNIAGISVFATVALRMIPILEKQLEMNRSIGIQTPVNRQPFIPADRPPVTNLDQ